MDAQEDQKRAPKLFDTVLGAVSYVLIGIAIISFFYLLPSTIADFKIIKDIPTDQYLLFNFKLSSGIFILIIAGVAFASIIAVGTFFVKLKMFPKGFTGKTSIPYFRYFSLYVLVQLIFSALVAYFIPSISKEFPYNTPFSAQNYFISSSILFSTILLDFVPIVIALCVYLVLTGKFSLSNLLKYEVRNNNMLLIAFILAIIISALEGGPIIILISDLFITFVLNIIIIKFGFFKGFLSYFTLSLAGIAESAISSFNPFLSLVIYIVLLILGFLGIYSLFSMEMLAQKPMRNKSVNQDLGSYHQENKIESPRRERNLPRIDLFVRSSCPNCGNTSFHVLNNMTLKCSKCEYELDKEAMGPPNITIEYRRNLGI